MDVSCHSQLDGEVESGGSAILPLHTQKEKKRKGLKVKKKKGTFLLRHPLPSSMIQGSAVKEKMTHVTGAGGGAA